MIDIDTLISRLEETRNENDSTEISFEDKFYDYTLLVE